MQPQLPNQDAMLMDAYDYALPPDRIAQDPLPERDASKLLVYRHGEITESVYRNLATHLSENALLIFNNTRVIHARFLFPLREHTIELFCLEPHTEKEMAMAMQKRGNTTWTCLIGNNRKWKDGALQMNLPDGLVLTATRMEPAGQAYHVQFEWTPATYTFSEVLEIAGHVPLPPYIKRKDKPEDTERYQTVYAEVKGSVAAPTAGLHFTPAVFASMAERNIQKANVTLHVGAGTFKPVSTASVTEHEMHAEWAEVSVETIQQLALHKGPLISVGTTSLRTLESLYWLSIKLQHNPNLAEEEFFIGQWEPYNSNTSQSYSEAMQYLLQWCEKHQRHQLVFKTQILIAPGYTLRSADALITNFHQPKSTLLLLVSAIVGTEWKKIYAYALDHGFRFLSYGDGSLLWRK